MDFLSKLFKPKDTQLSQSIPKVPSKILPLLSIIPGDPMFLSGFSYPHSNRRVLYRTELLEATPSELSALKSMLNEAKLNAPQTSFFRPESLSKPRKIILDTDIGTDIDDVLALLMILHIDVADVMFMGITTNYHPTYLRQHVAKDILNKADPPFNKVPVIPGPSGLMGTHREYFHHGNEGLGLGLNKKEIAELWKVNDTMEAPEFIYKVCKENFREVTIISIGIPTNLGLCAYLYKDFEDVVGHIYVMGGGSILMKSKAECIKGEQIFDLPNDINEIDKLEGIHLFPNHNISGDTLASQYIFNMKCPISLNPHHITSEHWLQGVSIETLLHYGANSIVYKAAPYISLCGRLTYEWLRSRWGQRGQCPHDPLTVYEAIYAKEEDIDDVNGKFKEKEPSLKYLRGNFIVHEWAGYMSFVKDCKGKHRIAMETKGAEEWTNWLGEKLIEKVAFDDRCKRFKGKL